jgi:mono/diheme cytochrome c family protein
VPEYGIRSVLTYPGGEIWFKPTGTTPFEMTIEGSKCPWKRGTVGIHAKEREAYFDWASESLHPPRSERPLTLNERGERRYHSKCEACHSVDGTSGRGRTFRGMLGSKVPCTNGADQTVDAEYMLKVIMDADACDQGDMPAFSGQLSAVDLYALVEFIKAQGSASETKR